MIGHFFLIFVFIISILPDFAHAADQLRYNADISLRAQNAIKTYLTHVTPPLAAATFAPTDLNKDGINEYIARDSSCTPTTPACRHLILADTDHGIVVLGDITARAISLGNGYTSGVRDLEVANNPGNDFAADRYIWDASQSRYTLKVKGARAQ